MNGKTPMELWLAEEISAGKFCELVNVPRHVGEEQILHAVWNLKCELELCREKLRAFEILKKCLHKVDEFNVFDVAMLYEKGSEKPYTVLLSGNSEECERAEIDSCSSAETLEAAIEKFSEKILKNEQIRPTH